MEKKGDLDPGSSAYERNLDIEMGTRLAGSLVALRIAHENSPETVDATIRASLRECAQGVGKTDQAKLAQTAQIPKDNLVRRQSCRAERPTVRAFLWGGVLLVLLVVVIFATALVAKVITLAALLALTGVAFSGRSSSGKFLLPLLAVLALNLPPPDGSRNALVNCCQVWLRFGSEPFR